MTSEDATRVGVGDEDGAAGRIEKDRVDRLGPEAGHGEQLATKRAERRTAHADKPPAEAHEQPCREIAQPFRLEAVRSRRPDRLEQHAIGRGGERARVEQTSRAQRGHRARGLAPRGVLREDRPGGDLERAAPRPPALRPETTQQLAVETQQACTHDIARRSGDASPRRERGTG